jgi:hypothetical protein
VPEVLVGVKKPPESADGVEQVYTELPPDTLKLNKLVRFIGLRVPAQLAACGMAVFTETESITITAFIFASMTATQELGLASVRAVN